MRIIGPVVITLLCVGLVGLLVWYWRSTVGRLKRRAAALEEDVALRETTLRVERQHIADVLSQVVLRLSLAPIDDHTNAAITALDTEQQKLRDLGYTPTRSITHKRYE